MQRWMRPVGFAFCLFAGGARAADKPAMELWRLDCGKFQINNVNLFSDADACGPGPKQVFGSCCLIRYGDTYMLWDTGLPV
jgi:N-acyl homoserine lactone hydrolase